MSILESYKDLFLNPRDCAKDKLKHGLKWYEYVAILLGLSILIGALQILSGTAPEEAVPLEMFFFVMTFLAIFVINHPFRKKMKASEYYKVNLAFQAYGSAVSLVISAITIASEIIQGILAIVLTVWLTICYCKAISELHKVSAWAIFGMSVVAVFIIGISFILFVLGWQAIGLPGL